MTLDLLYLVWTKIIVGSLCSRDSPDAWALAWVTVSTWFACISRTNVAWRIIQVLLLHRVVVIYLGEILRNHLIRLFDLPKITSRFVICGGVSEVCLGAFLLLSVVQDVWNWHIRRSWSLLLSLEEILMTLRVSTSFISWDWLYLNVMDLCSVCSKRIILSTVVLIVCACYRTFLKILLGGLHVCASDTAWLHPTRDIRLLIHLTEDLN